LSLLQWLLASINIAFDHGGFDLADAFGERLLGIGGRVRRLLQDKADMTLKGR
jgi:hypothetical protein